MWFLLLNGRVDDRQVDGNRVGRITPDGTITEFAIPSQAGSPTNIAVGPDRNIWFTKQSVLGRVTPDGVITEFPVPSGGTGLTAGSDQTSARSAHGQAVVCRVRRQQDRVLEFSVARAGAEESDEQDDSRCVGTGSGAGRGRSVGRAHDDSARGRPHNNDSNDKSVVQRRVNCHWRRGHLRAVQVVEGWPKDLSTLPGHEKWTYGGARGVFAESPNRVYLLGGGELPNLPRPQARQLTEIGPNVQFPIAGLPWRNANTATPPGNGGVGSGSREGHGGLERRVAALPRARRRRSLGTLPHRRRRAREHHRRVDAVGQDVQASARGLRQPVRRTEARVGGRRSHARDLQVYPRRESSCVQTIGTPNVPGADATHFNRPTFMAWLPDGSFYVATGTTVRASRSSTRTASSCSTSAWPASEPGRKRGPGI